MKGTERIWVVGDDFASRSFDPYFKLNKDSEDTYMMSNYKVTGYNNNKFLSVNQNMVSRLRNTIVTGFKEQTYAPKFVIIVLDDDLVKYVNFPHFGISDALG